MKKSDFRALRAHLVSFKASIGDNHQEDLGILPPLDQLPRYATANMPIIMNSPFIFHPKEQSLQTLACISKLTRTWIFENVFNEIITKYQIKENYIYWSN